MTLNKNSTFLSVLLKSQFVPIEMIKQDLQWFKTVVVFSRFCLGSLKLRLQGFIETNICFQKAAESFCDVQSVY